MKESNKTGTFRVLTLDGGGMRGLYTASKLQALARLFNERFVKQEPDIGKGFDLICGTSTGAILASALAVGVPLSRVCDLYCQFGSSIFPEPMPDTNRKGMMYWWSFLHSNRPAASPDVLRQQLSQIFKDQTLGDVYKSRRIAMCIPTVDALSHKAWVFKTPHNPDKHRDTNYKLVDVCMASAAAPIFFPLSRQLNPNNARDIHYFVDGGLWANNPVMVGLIEALVLAPPEQSIEVISVGTCDRPAGDPYATQDPNWGLLDWKVGVNIIDMSLSAQTFGYDSMAKFLASTLTASGRSVTVVRLEQSQKSPEQYSAIGLDRADQTAINTLVNMAGKDAEHIHSMAMADKSREMSTVASIFRNLDPLANTPLVTIG
jgi:hypothetical protein